MVKRGLIGLKKVLGKWATCPQVSLLSAPIESLSKFLEVLSMFFAFLSKFPKLLSMFFNFLPKFPQTNFLRSKALIGKALRLSEGLL